ncbi:hypothetical protein DM40_3980 [Burkholderia cenocepacia]|nr:hypothetical protein DM40_3980 [Burkholderia cenocepacia]
MRAIRDAVESSIGMNMNTTILSPVGTTGRHRMRGASRRHRAA